MIGGEARFHRADRHTTTPYRPYMHSIIHTRKRRGFSLLELLIAIAILGTIAAIAIVSLTGVGDSAKVTTARSQAQRIATVFAAGYASGAPVFIGANSVNAAMNAVGAGSSGSGTTRTAWFQLPGISAGMDSGKPAAHRAQHYLAWEDGMLVYNPEGGGASGGYSNFDEWIAALNGAMSQFGLQNPGASMEQAMAYYGSWITAHPPPDHFVAIN